MKHLCVVFMFFVLLTSCGVEKSSHPDAPPVTQITFSNQPLLLNKSSLECRNHSFAKEDSVFDLQIFQRGRNFILETNFFRFLSGIFLKDGKIISQAIYNEEIEILMTPIGEKLVKQTAGSPVFLCPDEKSYQSGSIESAALNATHFIEKTRAFFLQSVTGVKISPVRISISPAIVKSQLIRGLDGSVTKIGHYMTDNAFYQTSSKTISFLPHSESHRFAGSNVNLWEVPMVPAHEYGHHLFQEMLGSHYSSTPMHFNCFGTPVAEAKSFKNIRPRKVQIIDVIRAYHEGFADLIAHYALPESERSVSGVRCLEVSRNVVSPRFYDGNPKIFSTEALRSYFSLYERAAVSCELTNYQDAHVMGAIFAHTYEKFSEELSISNEEKLAALAEWVKFLRSENQHLKKVSPEDFLKGSYGELLKITVRRFNRTFDDSICKKVEEIFPDLNLAECSN